MRSIPSREVCKACYEINRVGFTVPDEIWRLAVPEKLQDQVLCLNCFGRFADEHLLPWDRAIQFWSVSLATHLEQELGLQLQAPSAGQDAQPAKLKEAGV